jgi:hypothetical protein
MDLDRAQQLIRELSPLAAATVELLGAGTEGAAFRVDGEWVVRFPLAPQAQGTLSTELALLPQLAARLPSTTPVGAPSSRSGEAADGHQGYGQPSSSSA